MYNDNGKSDLDLNHFQIWIFINNIFYSLTLDFYKDT